MDFAYFAPGLPDAIRNRPITAALVSLQSRVGTLSRQISYALFALLVWDALLTLKDEVHLIWPARWTVIKGLFLINRYGAPVMIALGFTTASGYLHNLTDGFCQKWLLTNMGTEQLFLLLVSFVMVFRLHAAWDTNRTLLLTLVALWLAGVTATFFAWVHVLYSQRQWIWAVKFFNVCFPEVPGLWRLFVPNACLHFVLLSILIVKAVATPRSKNTAMLIILLRDGIAFYSITFCVTFAAVMIWAFSPKVWFGFPIYTTWSITTMATSRFLLSLKYSQGVQQSWSKRRDILSHPVPANGGLSRQPTGKLIEMETRRDWKGRTLSGDSSASMSPRHELPTLPTLPTLPALSPLSPMYTQYDASNSQETGSIQAPIASQTVLIDSPTATSQDLHRRHLAFAAMNQRRGLGGWWWWLLGRGAVPENQMIEVDVSHAEWWDEWEDRGPGWQESKIGRYDGWL